MKSLENFNLRKVIRHFYTTQEPSILNSKIGKEQAT